MKPRSRNQTLQTTQNLKNPSTMKPTSIACNNPQDKIKTITQTTTTTQISRTKPTNLSKRKAKGAHLAVEEEDPMVEAIEIVGDLRPPPFLLLCGSEKHRNGSTLKANLDAIILELLSLSLYLPFLLSQSRCYFCSLRARVSGGESAASRI